jgi:hypothetical protein
VQVTALCFIPKAWAAHFLDQISPYEAYQHYKELQVTIPVMDQPQLCYMEACWLKAACLQVSMLLTAKWQAPMIDDKVNTWVEWHTHYINTMPFGAQTPMVGATVSLDI